jgi:hypothetical protein
MLTILIYIIIIIIIITTVPVAINRLTDCYCTHFSFTQ